MRVVLHGFGSFPIVFWHMIQHARTIDAPIDWAIILTTDHHRELFVKLLGAERVTVLDHAGSERHPGPRDLFYPGALYRDIEAEKRTFKYAPAGKQYARAMGLYRQVRDFMRGFGPTHALVSQVEGFDGKVFIAAAREYGAEVVVPTSCRNLGGTFFRRMMSSRCRCMPMAAKRVIVSRRRRSSTTFVMPPSRRAGALMYLVTKHLMRSFHHY